MTAPTETPTWSDVHPGIEVGPDVAGRWAIVVHGMHQISFNDRDDAVKGAECWWCHACEKVVMDMSMHACETPSLTTEQAREYAAKWAWWQDGGGVDTERPESLAAHEGGVSWVRRLLEMRYPDVEREQLFAWVRARMAETTGTQPNVREDWAGDVADSLDLWDADGECPLAWALCEQAEWPS